MSYESLMDADFDQLTAVQRQILDVSDADTQVLTFTIGRQKYCVDVGPVSEVLWNEHDMTQVPEMPPHVVGISNLRGRSVEIVDPKGILDVEDEGPEENVILFEQTAGDNCGYAWLVDTVEQVLSISYEEVDESVTDDQIRGIIERDDELITWLSKECFSTEVVSDSPDENIRSDSGTDVESTAD